MAEVETLVQPPLSREIWTTMRLSRVRFAAMLLAVGLAAIPALVWVQGRAPTYEAEANVSVLAFSGGELSAFDLGPFMEDFTVVVTSRIVLDTVAATTGESVELLESGLDVGRRGSGTNILLTYSSKDAQVAEMVVLEAGKTALATLAEIELEPAQRELEAARNALDEARTSQAELEAQYGVADIPGQISRLVDETFRLRNEIQLAQRPSSSADLPVLEQQLASLESELAELNPAEAEALTLASAISRAEARASDALSRVESATTRLTATESERVVSLQGVEEAAKTQDAVIAIATAGVLTTLASVGVFILLDRREERMRQSDAAGVLRASDLPSIGEAVPANRIDPEDAAEVRDERGERNVSRWAKR